MSLDSNHRTLRSLIAKTIKDVEFGDDHGRDVLRLIFTDDSTCDITYDWIYDVELKDAAC